MKAPAIHFDSDGPDYLQRMRRVWTAPVYQVPFSVKVAACLMCPIVVGVMVLLLAGLWACAQVGWIEEE